MRLAPPDIVLSGSFSVYILVNGRLILEKATLVLQRWGNSLAVRIPLSIAKSAGFKVGQPVEVFVQHSAVRVAPAEESQLTLKQKLARFDPARHGGEAMATGRAGNEAL
jgi:antitoxin MazE